MQLTHGFTCRGGCNKMTSPAELLYIFYSVFSNVFRALFEYFYFRFQACEVSLFKFIAPNLVFQF